MKKALVVANLAGFAGFLVRDMATLKEMGYEVTFAANANKLSWDKARSRLEALNVGFVQIDFDSKSPLTKQNLRAYRQLKALMKENQYDLLHCHTPIAGILARLAARNFRKSGMKVIYTTHGLSYTTHSSKKHRFIYRTIEKIGSKHSDAIITINQEDYKEAQTLKCKQVYYIHGVGVDIERFTSTRIDRDLYRESIGVGKDKIMVLSVGELSPRKNHIAIVEAIAMMENKDDYAFVICGNGIGGGTGEILRKRAEELGVELHLLGFRADVPEVMLCSDIGAIPSTREGLGLAGVQSLSVGVPLIGTDVQGIRDYIKDGETGYLCSAHDVAGFAEAIRKLSNKETRDAMRSSCLEMSTRFDVPISREEMKKIYALVLGKES